MKKSVISAVLSTGIWVALQAQPVKKDSVEIEIEGSRITLEAGDLSSLSTVDLNQLIKEVVEKATKIQQQQQEMLARVDRQLKNGEITDEQAEDMRETIKERTEESMEVIGELMETWGEAYGAYWEAWADQYEARMEQWEMEMDKRAQQEGRLRDLPPLPALPPLPELGAAPAPPDSTEKSKRIIISDEGIIIKHGDDEEENISFHFKDKRDTDDGERKKIDAVETYFDINFGFNQLLEDGYAWVSSEPAEQKFWKSTTFDLGLGAKIRMGSPYSKFYLKWGGEVSWHNFRLYGNNILVKDPATERAALVNDTLNSYSKSKFEITYLNMPVMFQLDLSEVGEMDESFTLGLGGYVGVRIHSERELEYNDFEGAEVEEEYQNDLYTNSFRYGVMAQLGWKALKVTAKYDLNPYFQSGGDPLEIEGTPGAYQMASISIGFTL